MSVYAVTLNKNYNVPISTSLCLWLWKNEPAQEHAVCIVLYLWVGVWGRVVGDWAKVGGGEGRLSSTG